MFHAWPVFTFVAEGREGERKLLVDINLFRHEKNGLPLSVRINASAGEAI